MQMHAIVEIEEGSLNVLVGGRDGAITRVVRSIRIPLTDMSGDSIENALRTVGSDILQGAPGVHVVIGDRRSEHFLSTLPKMSSRDAVAFVGREASRLTNLQSADEVLVAPRLVKRLPRDQVLIGTSALGRSVWEPVRAAFEKRSLEVLSLQTIEACLALTVDACHSDPIAVLECNGGRARYVLCSDQTPIKVRRFLIGGGGDQNETTLLTQLAMELPRTIDWLRETGQPLPRRLMVGSRLGLSDESLKMLANDDVGELVRSNLDVACDEDLSTPDVGVASLLHRLAHGQQPLSLLGTPQLRMPAGKGYIVTMMAAASVAVLGGLSAAMDGSAWWQARSEHEGLRSQCDQLHAELAAAAVANDASDALALNPQLTQALSMRRPISRLLSDVSNSAGPEISIDEVKFASKSPVTVSGLVRGSDRHHALAAMGDFTKKVYALPYLISRGDDEVSEMSGQPNTYHFKLSLAWETR